MSDLRLDSVERGGLWREEGNEWARQSFMRYSEEAKEGAAGI